MMWRRLARVSLQILLALAVVELGLQGIALVVQSTTRSEMQSGWSGDDLRILCLGDSNTYGVLVPRDETWPAQLQRIWNEEVGSPRVEVLNLGFPGTNTSRLVRDFPRLLETLQPDLTIIMAGVNDFWTLPFPSRDESGDEPGNELEASQSAEPFWKRTSKLYRLYFLLKQGLESDEIEIELDPNASLDGGKHTARIGDQEFEMGWKAATPGGQLGNRTDLRKNLGTLVEQAEAGGTRLVLMTYPSRFQLFYKVANPEILRVAAKTGTPLINLTRAFQPICPSIPCPDYLLKDDHHPNARGYEVVAQTVKDGLQKQLR